VLNHVKQQPLLSNGSANNGSINATTALQQRNGVFYAVCAGCYKQGQLGAAVSFDNHWGSAVVSCCCEKLVAETGVSSGTQ
jgi:hypothetical protein